MKGKVEREGERWCSISSKPDSFVSWKVKLEGEAVDLAVDQSPFLPSHELDELALQDVWASEGFSANQTFPTSRAARMVFLSDSFHMLVIVSLPGHKQEEQRFTR